MNLLCLFFFWCFCVPICVLISLFEQVIVFFFLVFLCALNNRLRFLKEYAICSFVCFQGIEDWH